MAAKKKLEVRSEKLERKQKSLKKSSPTTDNRQPTTSLQPPQTMEELLAATGYQVRGLKKGSVVQGTITRLTPKEVTIDIGGKTEGVVMDKELENYREMIASLDVGDQVTAQVVVPENDRGQTVLSIRRAIFERLWKKLVEYQKSGEAVEVVFKEQVRGGILVDYGGIRGYVPLSQLDNTLVRQLDKLTGRRASVKVIEVDQATNRLVFSQRAVAEQANLAKQKELLDAIVIDTTVEAAITNIAPFGAFAKFTVEKDGEKHDVEGLIHISEIAWEKVEDPNQYLKVGDKLKVKVIGAAKETGKVTLSVKQLLPDPWKHVFDQFAKDSQVTGKVTRTTPYGIFVELSPGVEGLVHISKITPGQEPKEGDEIDCIVEDVKPDQRKISLSLALKEKPIGYR